MDKGKESSTTRYSKRKESFKDLVKTGKDKGKKRARRNSVSSEDELDDLFIWEKYLEKCHAKAVPKTAFKHVTDAKSSGFTRGMKVEARDQTSSSESYWVATVVMVSGPLLLLRFDGYNEDRSGDFWFNSNSELLHPIGWCAKTNNVLIPPATIRHKKNNWAKFLVENLRDAVAAPDDLFLNQKDDSDNGYLKVGTTVEVQDDKDPLCYWTANIIEKLGLRLHLRFTGYEDEDHDIWEYYFADCLHSIGWGNEMGMMLKPPKVLEKYNKWSLYKNFVINCRKESQRISKDKPVPKNNGLKPGMKLEAVNPEFPQRICVATVKEILSDIFFTVELDCLFNSKTHIKFVCHTKSKYIFPVGWCKKNNINIEPPTGYSTSDFQWDKYLDIKHAEAAPESLFDKDNVKCTTYKPDFNFLERVELLNEEEPSCYWIADVTDQVNANKYHLQLKGSNTCRVNAYHYSDLVKPRGWGIRNGLRLKPPKVMTREWKEEIDLLEGMFKAENSATSPMQKLDKQDDLPPVHNFQPGMQLEAVNPQDPSSICVASVIERNSPHYFTVQIDTAMETSDNDLITFWCFNGSKKIFPIGWCRKNNVQLTPPPGYPDTEFVWDVYMKVKKTKPAPESLFNMTPPSSDFQIGLKLEAADQTNPSTISVASLTQIVGGTVWVQLDGYQASPVEQIYDIQSYNLFPVGWCSMHGHPLLAPQQKKKESETRRWAASLRKRVSDTNLADTCSKRQRQDSNQTINSHKSNDKTKKTKKQVKTVNSNVNESKTPIKPVTSAAATPSSSTEDTTSSQQRDDEAESSDTSTASESDNAPKPTTTIDLTNEYSREGDKELVLFIKSSCSCGPYIDKYKLAKGPDLIGPGPPNKVLKQVVEQVVLSAYSGAKVLDLLSSEKEKQSFLSILKTLSTKLLICENLFSLNKVNTCSKCDTVDMTKYTVSVLDKPSSTTTTLPNSTTKPTTPIPGNPDKTTTTLNNNSNIDTQSTIKKTIINKSTKSTLKPALQSPTAVIHSTESPTLSGFHDDDVFGRIPNKHISTWSINEVVDFVTPRGCKNFASVFQEQEVDGKALMLLSLDDIHKVLGVTLGPAIKLHDDVQKLRDRKK